MKLTAKEEKFVQGIIAGKSQRQAYKEAYNTSRMKDKTVDEKACRMFKSDKISARYRELQEKAENKAIITKDKLLEGLVEAFEMAKGSIESKLVVNEFGKLKQESKLKTDLKSISGIAGQIMKLQGWDRAEEKENQEDKLDKLIEKLDEALNE